MEVVEPILAIATSKTDDDDSEDDEEELSSLAVPFKDDVDVDADIPALSNENSATCSDGVLQCGRDNTGNVAVFDGVTRKAATAE